MFVDYFSDEIAWSHLDMTPSMSHDRCFGEVIRGVEPDDEVKYVMNSYGHRSDEFTNIHKGKHALFVGCSTTLGEGLPYMKNWSGRLYEKLSEEEEMSGYYNLSYLGGSIYLMIDNIYKYVDKFGAPNYLFCHFPDTNRYIKHFKDNNYINSINYNFENLDPQRFMDGYLSLRSLEKYCEAKGINLFYGIWHEKENKKLSEIKTLKRIIGYQWADVFAMSTPSSEDRNSKYFSMARDGAHPGYQYSSGAANIYYERFKNEKDKNLLV